MAVTKVLTYQDLVTPTELSEAVAAAGKYGGSIADHLLRLGFAKRPELLAVLSHLSGCPAVDLREISIDKIALDQLPAALAWRLKCIPVACDLRSPGLSLASSNPKDKTLQSELAMQLPGYRMTYLVTLESDLKCALTAYYREAVLAEEQRERPKQIVVATDGLTRQMISISGMYPGTDLPATDLDEILRTMTEVGMPTKILIIAPEEVSTEHLAQALRCDNCAVRTAVDVPTAMSYCQAHRFTHVFVHSSFSDMAVDLLLQLRDHAPEARVRFFGGIREFVLAEEFESSPGSADNTAIFGKTIPIPIGEANSRSQLLLFDPLGSDCAGLKCKLEASLFAVHTVRTARECATYVRQEGADIVLICRHGSADGVAEIIGELAAFGYVMDRVPTYILTDVDSIAHLNWLLARGVEDIIPIDPEWQSLVIKLNRMRGRLEQEKGERIQVLHDLGTHGTLKDMNVIDLLQAMGPGDKTVRISVTGSGKHLTMFLDHGKLTYAACDDKLGAEAVYEGLAWKAGIWSVDPISRDDLPEPNNERGIDSILIEGCHLLDKLNRSEFSSLT